MRAKEVPALNVPLSPQFQALGRLANRSAIRDIYANALIAGGFPLLFGMYLLPTLFIPFGLPNVIWPAFAIIVASLLVLGSKALTRTPFDGFFVVWVALALASHIFAVTVLARNIDQAYLMLNVGFVLSMGLLFRAVYCLILLNPRSATRMFLLTLAVLLAAAFALGLMEKFGPGKAWAIGFASRFASKQNALDAVSLDRPSSIFEGPNLLGYADIAFCCLALGWGLTDIARTKLWKVVVVMGCIGFAALSALAGQTRSTVLLLAIFPVIYGIQLRRRALNQATLAVFGGFLFAGLIGLLLIVQTGKFSYLKGVSEKGIAHDLSYQTRVKALRDLERVATDIAPLGAGVAQSNSRHLTYNTGYSRYDTIGIDNEWANAFEAFGVWGPLWIAVLMLVWYRESVSLAKIAGPEARIVLTAGLCLLIANILISPSAVRMLKYETAGYTFAILAIISAWKLTLRPKPLPASS